MRNTIYAAIGIMGTGFAIAFFIFNGPNHKSAVKPIATTVMRAKPPQADTKRASRPKVDLQPAVQHKNQTLALNVGNKQKKAVPVLDESENEPYPRHIEDIKKQIYDIGIEYVEDIELLDDIVQTGNADVSEFWGGEWNSADDWKAEGNGFRLEQETDGSFTFYPDEVTTRLFSFFDTPQPFNYDAENNEFTQEVDYYGKIITNRIKFINDKAAVLMTISGIKVVTEIYQKNGAEEG